MTEPVKPPLAPRTDEQIGELLTDGHRPEDIASYMVDGDVARGEYEGGSTELEIAYGEHLARVKRLAPPPEDSWVNLLEITERERKILMQALGDLRRTSFTPKEIKDLKEKVLDARP